MSRLVIRPLMALVILSSVTACVEGEPQGAVTGEPDTDAGDTPGDDGGPAPDAEPDPEPSPVPLDCPQDEVACGQQCTSLQSDPINCGLCGRTCVIPNASATCLQGECQVEECDAGFADADGELDNGCELPFECEPGAPCQTTCDSQGQTECLETEPLCRPPTEQCNGVDDDCNDQCDEALMGCFVGVHRAHGNGHLFTTNLETASGAPYNLEFQNYFFIYTGTVSGTRPLFLCRKANGKRFLTSDTACNTLGGNEGQMGFWAPQPLCGSVPLYGLFHEASDNHFYTLSAQERDNAINNLGYLDAGIAAYVWTAK